MCSKQFLLFTPIANGKIRKLNCLAILLLFFRQQVLLNKISKELDEIKDTTSVLRRRLAEMMNSLMSDLVSE